MKLEGKYKRIQVIEVANPDGKIISRSVIAYDNAHDLDAFDLVYKGYVDQLVANAPTIEITVEEANPTGGRVGDVNITPDGTVYQLELVGEEEEWVLKGQIKTGGPAIIKEYVTTSAMIAAQGSDEQEAGELFFVTADGFYYEYLGTTTGTIADYRIQSQGDIRNKALDISARWTFSAGAIIEYAYAVSNRIRARFRDVLNAVNYITLGNSVSGQNPYVSAGDSVDANRGIDFRAKGNAKHNITGLYYNAQSVVERVLTLFNGDLNAEYELKNGSILADVPDVNGIRLDDNGNWEIDLYNFLTCEREGPKGAISSDSDYIYFAIEDNIWLRINVNSADSGLELGETSATAYRGDRGKAAYDHSQEIGNPHETSIGDIENLGIELSNRYTKSETNDLLDNKVDIVAGSRLINSSEITKLGTIEEGAQVNPTDVSELNNDAGYLAGNTPITPGTAAKVTYDAKGLVTGGGNLAASDIPNLPASKITSGTNSAFNKDFGTAVDTVAEGNHNHSGVYEPVVTPGTTGQYYRGDKSWQSLDKTAVGLGNVDNTADEDKPVSNAVQVELDARPFDIVRDYEKVTNSTSGDEELFSIALDSSELYSNYIEFEGTTTVSSGSILIKINGNTEQGASITSTYAFRVSIEVYDVSGFAHFFIRTDMGGVAGSRVFESTIAVEDPIVIAINSNAAIGGVVLRKRVIQKSYLT